ncbi:hypothetical protein D3C73_1657560 [compost metagenome]
MKASIASGLRICEPKACASRCITAHSSSASRIRALVLRIELGARVASLPASSAAVAST